MICTFFGHSNSPNTLIPQIEEIVTKLIVSHKVSKFLVGNNGNFDLIVQKILKSLSKSKLNFDYYIVLSSINETALSGEQEVTVFPEELARCPSKYRIYKRNEYLIKNSHYAITYVKKQFSNSKKWKEKAISKNLVVIDIL